MNLLGYTPWEIGVIFAAIPLVRFLAPFLFLKHLRVTSSMVGASSIGFALLAALFPLTIHHFWLFLLNHLIMGFVVTVILPYIEAVALENLKERYGKSRLFGSIGFILVALGMAPIIQSPDAILYSFTLIVFATALSALWLRHAHTDHSVSEDVSAADSRFSIIQHAPVWANTFLMQMSFGAFYNFFTIYESEHGLSIEIISYLWTFGVLCEIAMFYLQTPLFKRFSTLSLMRFATLATAIRWLILFLFPGSLLWVVISQAFHAVSFALYHTATISHLHSLYPQRNLAQQFYSGLSYGLGLFAGSLIAGITYGEYLFLISAGISVVAWWVLSPKKRYSES